MRPKTSGRACDSSSSERPRYHGAVSRLLPLLLLFAVGCYPVALIEQDDDAAFSDDDDDVAGDDDDIAPDDDDVTDDDDEAPDADGDGTPDADDCAPDDPAVHPGAVEECNGADDNCDGQADEGLGQDWYLDNDGDGWGDPATAFWACDPPPEGIGQGNDCDDTNPDIHPGSTVQVDGVDSDCDGLTDWLMQVWISGDDDFEWCLDDENAMTPGGTSWPVGALFEVWVETGSHVIGIRGWDTGQVITAMIAHIELSDGSMWISDASWKFDPNPAADDDTRGGWCAVGFDDTAWQNANVIGPIGTSPWGNAPSSFPPGSPANWIWDYYPVNLNTQYLRLQIEIP